MSRKNLRKRGEGYAVVYYVPKEFQAKLGGKREIVRGLGTRDEKEAMRLKAAKLLEISAEVHRLVSHEPPEALLAEAASIAAIRRQGGDPHGDPDDGLAEFVVNGAEAVEARHGSDIARRYADIAFGRHIPISIAAQEWRKEWRGITAHTRAKYERTLRAFQNFFDDRPLDRITRRDAVEYYRHLRETPSERTGRPLAAASVSLEIHTLVSFFKACRTMGLLPWDHENPFKEVTARLPGQKGQPDGGRNVRAVTRIEAERFLSAIRSKSRKYGFEMEALVRLLWVTGARANEIASLTRDRISEADDLIWISIADAKTAAGNRWLCLVGEGEQALLREALCRADTALVEENIPAENQSLLFPRLRRGGHDRKPYWYLGKALEKVRKKTFGEDVAWDMHSFRRTAAAALVNAKVAEAGRKLVLGHSTSGDIGLHVYAQKGDLWDLIEDTMRALYHELGGGL